jgi:hypothetical protein
MKRLLIKDLDNYEMDFIPDVHGSATLLKKLLKKLGYKKDKNGIFFHKTRKAFFLGDFIDGGDEVEEAFYIIKSMVESGYAFSIMGNHEINLIAFNEKSKKGDYFLRPRSNNNINQCKKSLELILGKNSKENILFLKSLPLFVETDSFRAIHACWDSKSINMMSRVLDEENRLTDKLIHLIYENKNRGLYNFIETLLKGPEISLSEENSFKDNYGKLRTNCRYNWWDKNKSIVNEDLNISDVEHNHDTYNEKKIVFFGHYWMKGTPRITSEYAQCLDFSAVKSGILCAYRHDNSNKLNSNKITFVDLNK